MDCRVAQTRLDLLPFDGTVPAEGEWHEALAHLDDCQDCQTIVENRQAFDRRIAATMADVAVPAGLRERLLAAVDAAATTAPGVLPREQAPRPTRRRWLRLALASSAVAIAAAVASGWWLVSTRETPLALEAARLGIHDQLVAANDTLSALPEFDGNFDASVRDNVWRRWITGGPRGLNVNHRGKQDAAVYTFQIPGARGATGYLVVLPTRQLTDPPELAIPTEQQLRYQPRQTVAWTRGDQVYLCYVIRGQVQAVRSLYGTPA